MQLMLLRACMHGLCKAVLFLSVCLTTTSWGEDPLLIEPLLAVLALKVLTQEAYHGLLTATTDNGWSLIHTGMHAGHGLCIARVLDAYLEAGLPDAVLHEMLTAPLETTGQTPLLLGIQGKVGKSTARALVPLQNFQCWVALRRVSL